MCNFITEARSLHKYGNTLHTRTADRAEDNMNLYLTVLVIIVLYDKEHYNTAGPCKFCLLNDLIQYLKSL